MVFRRSPISGLCAVGIPKPMVSVTLDQWQSSPKNIGFSNYTKIRAAGGLPLALQLSFGEPDYISNCGLYNLAHLVFIFDYRYAYQFGRTEYLQNLGF